MKKAVSKIAILIHLVASLGFAAFAGPTEKSSGFKNIQLASFTPKPLGTSPALGLADLKNKVVLIDFWASWCAPCKEALPHYNKLYVQHRDQGLLILGINEDDSPADRDQFLKTTPIHFPTYADPNREFLKQLQVEALPTLFLLNKKTEIVLSLRGLSKKNTQILDEKIKQLLKE